MPASALLAMLARRSQRGRAEFGYTLLKTSPEFWLNLQTAYDLAQSRPHRSVRALRKTG